MLKPNKRINVRNALVNALNAQGVPVTIEIMDKALAWVELGDSRPNGVPAIVQFRGVTHHWPFGRETRVPNAHEMRKLNDALKLNGVQADGLLTGEDNVRVYRRAYEALVNKVVAQPEMRLPILTQRQIEAAQALVDAEWPEINPLSDLGVLQANVEHVIPEVTLVTDVPDLFDNLLAQLAELTERISE